MQVQPSSGSPFESSENDEMFVERLTSLLGAVRRRWWLLASFGIALGVAGAYQAQSQPTIYRASATLLLESRPRVIDKVTAVTADEGGDNERYDNSQARILTSDRMARTVETTLKMPAGSLAGRIGVVLDRGSELMTLSIDDLNPDAATKIVNAFADAYIESNVTDHVGVAADAAQLLDAQAKDHRAKLEAAERELYDFQRNNGLPASNFEESHKILSSTLQSLHAQAATAYAIGVKLRADLEQLHAAKGDTELSRRLAMAGSGEQRDSLSTRYQTAEIEAAQAELRYGPKHPKVAESREAVEMTGQSLDREYSASAKMAESRVRANASEQAQIRSAIESETKHALSLRQLELEYNRLKRNLDEDRESYDLVAKRQKELEIAATIRQSNVRRLDAAAIASQLGRNVPRHTMIGVLIGLAIGLALALGLDHLDDVVRTPQEAEGRLRGPLLGFISELPASKGDGPQEQESNRAAYIGTYPRSVIAEQCHSVSTNIFSQFLEAPPRAIAIASSASRDGKTLTCVNLASTAAARGKRVLLIDADLRRGRMHTLFGLPRGSGLFELAVGQCTIEQACRRTSIPGVDVVTSGDLPDKVSPVRVLELPHLRAVVAELREKYDLLLFDTPPVPMVSDTLVMKDLFDGAVGIFRAEQTSTRLGVEMARQLRVARINFLGWVLNGVSERELKKRYYYRKYGYASGYEPYSDAKES